MQTRRAAAEYRLRLLTGSISEGVLALEQGAADFLLAYRHPRLPLALGDASFESMPFGRDELVAVSASPSNGKPLCTSPCTAKNPVNTLGYTPTRALAQALQDGLQRQIRVVKAL